MSKKRKALLLLAVPLFLLTLFLSVTHQGRTAFKTALFVPEVVPRIPIKPQRFLLGDPTREELSYPLESGQGLADLYRPSTKGKHSAVLLFLGVNPAGRDDPRVVSLAKGLARAGMLVMVPWSETMTQSRIASEEVDNLVSAFLALKALDSVDPDRVGMGGFCVGASLSIIAAADPRISNDVKFVNFFGGYFDAFDLLKAISANRSFYDGHTEPWQPHDLTQEVFTTELIESLDNPTDKEIIVRTFVNREKPLPNADQLTQEGRAVYRLLQGASLEEAENLLGRLSEKGKDKLALISPSTHLDGLRARVLIMQNREDDLIPVEESRRLADTLTDENQIYYTEFSFFQHVDPTKPVSTLTFAKESFKLFMHMYNILRYAA